MIPYFLSLLSFHKKFILLGIFVLTVVLINLTPQEGKTITIDDDVNKFSEIDIKTSLENQAAIMSLSESNDNDLKVGIFDRKTAIGEFLPDMEMGTISPSVNNVSAPFSQQANLVSPDITAEIALVSDLQSGIHYLEKGINRHWPIASVSKLMTAAIASRLMTSDTKIVLEPSDFPIRDISNTPYLKSGDAYLVGDLIKLLLVVSDNAAAEALARSYGREAFLEAMNDQAQDWGMTQTYFYDPSGLSPINQSSIKDLEKMTFQLYSRYKDIFSITRKSAVRVIEQNNRRERTLSPINAFVGQDEFLGGKTGFIDESGGNLLSLFSVKNRPVLIIVLNSQDRFKDSTALLEWFKISYD